MSRSIIYRFLNEKNTFSDGNRTNASSDGNGTNNIVADNRSVKLAVLLPCQVLSILCSLLVFFNILRKPAKFIKPVGNHFIIVLLVTSFVQVTTELSMVESYLDMGVVRPSTYGYCLFFNWYEFSLNGISRIVMSWASIERHIIIFSQSVFQIQWKRIVFHYIPLTCAIIYTPTIYGYLIFFYNCTNNWNYNELLCTAPCYYSNKVIGVFDWICNIIIPAFTIALANILLIIRVVYRSTGIRNNPERTKKNRKMTLQLLAISSLFLVFWLPIAVTGLIQQFFDPTFIIYVQFNVFFYLIYFIQLFLPLVCLISLPELKKTIWMKIRYFRQRNMVGNTTAVQVASIMPTVY